MEEFLIILLYPFVEQGFVMVENEIRELFTEFSRCTKGCESLGSSFLPFPEPDRVKMGIAYKIKAFVFFHLHSENI